MLINHNEDCKHIICRDWGHTKLMHQDIRLVLHSGDGRHWSKEHNSEEDQLCCGKIGR